MNLRSPRLVVDVDDDPPKPPLSNLKALCQLLFKIKIYDYQEKIMRAVIDRKKKITIRSTTRAGKTYTLAMTAIILAVFKDNHSIGIVAPTFDKARKFMEYIAQLLNESPLFNDIVMINTEGLTHLEKLRKEVSKRKITFTNGSSIEIKSIDLSRKGLAIMGMGYSTILVEEVGEIDEESYSRIYRMLVESQDTIICEIGNPWQLGFFFDHHHSPDWEKIHISWQDCVREGRMTKEAVEDQRKELTDIEFKILFDADFPQEIEFAIFPNVAITQAIRSKEFAQFDKILVGVDVASGGRDLTVVTVIGVAGNEFSYIEHKEIDSRDTMQTVGIIQEMLTKYPHAEVTVDSVGLGLGVKDRLKELKVNVTGFIAGSTARNDTRFSNIKTEAVFALSDIMKAGRFWNLPPASKYVLNLRSWIYEIRSDRQLKVIDPDKSPDYGDSLYLSMANSIYNITTRTYSGTIYPESKYRKGMLRARERFRRTI